MNKIAKKLVAERGMMLPSVNSGRLCESVVGLFACAMRLHGRFVGNYQELNAIKFTITRRQLPGPRRKRRGDARRYSRRLPSGSGNNRGGPEIVVSPDTPFLDGGIVSEFIGYIDHEHPYQWRRQPMEMLVPSVDGSLNVTLVAVNVVFLCFENFFISLSLSSFLLCTSIENFIDIRTFLLLRTIISRISLDLFLFKIVTSIS